MKTFVVWFGVFAGLAVAVGSFGGSGCDSPVERPTTCRTVANCLQASAPICDAATLTCRPCTAGADDIACKNRQATTPRCGPNGACVACVENAECAARDLRQPACRGFVCAACKNPTECQSRLCSADGSCAPVTDVLFVDNKNGACSGTGHKGTLGDPFCTVAEAVDAAKTDGKTLISVAASVAAYAPLSLDASTASVTISGSGATPADTRIGPSSPGQAAVTVSGDGTAKKPSIVMRNLEVRGQIACNNGAQLSLSKMRVKGGDSHGIHGDRCTLSVDSSEITDHNLNGIWLTQSEFALSNLMMGGNRVTAIALGVGNHGTMRFLTLVGNGNTTSTAPAGVDCGATDHSLEDSIVFDNYSRAGGVVSALKQIVGCKLENVVTNDPAATSGLFKEKLEFVSPVLGPTFDLHLVRDSAINQDACVDKVLQSPVDHDFDGTARPQGAAADIGAHEVQ